MAASFFIREAANADLRSHYAYLMEHAGQKVADRFIYGAYDCFGDIADQPEIGSQLSELRSDRDKKMAGQEF